MAKRNPIDVYRKNFGYIGLPWITANPKAYIPGGSPDIDTSNGSSFLGQPLFMPCKIGELQLQPEPIFEMSGGNRIIETPLDDEGSFKQRYSKKDFLITITGIMTNEEEPDNYPEDDIRALRNEVIEKAGSLVIANQLANAMGVQRVALYDYELPIDVGTPDQPYVLYFKSDKEYKLKLKEGGQP